MFVHVATYSLAIPMIQENIENETVNASIVTSSKPSEFSRIHRGYVVAPNFFFSSDLVKFFIMVHQVTNVSSFIECLELFLNFGHIFVGPSDVIPLAISDIHSQETHISLCFIFRSFTS